MRRKLGLLHEAREVPVQLRRDVRMTGEHVRELARIRLQVEQLGHAGVGAVEE